MVPNPRVPNISEILTIYDRHISLVAMGEETVEQAMQRATEEINVLIEEERQAGK